MPQTLKIDFVSDIACPWCVIGLRGLDRALEALHQEFTAEVVFHPFELNPDMPPGGQNSLEHITGKYGISAEEARVNRERIKARASAVGFTMNSSDTSRVYNTFDAHRLLAWAKKDGRQHALKEQLFALYFTAQADPTNRGALLDAVQKAGLNAADAGLILDSDLYADEVRSDERLWQRRGISSVPAVVVNDRYLISGGHAPEEFERQLLEIARKEVR